MTEVMVKDHDVVLNPLDLVERIVRSHEWPFDRYTRDEMNVGVEGCWTRYHLWFAWQNTQQALQFSCAFDLKVPQDKLLGTHSLLAIMNEKLWLGHFDVWDKEGLIIYRNSSIIDRNNLNLENVETLLLDAVNSIDLYFPAFQYILWAGKTSEEALSTVLFETRGEA